MDFLLSVQLHFTINQIKFSILFILLIVLLFPASALAFELESDSASTDQQTLRTSDFNPVVTYTTHVENLGTLPTVTGPETGGTIGQSLRMEAIKIDAELNGSSIPISYSSHIQDIGWQNAVNNNEISGTEGLAKRLEAITISISDSELAEKYNIWYRVHAQDYGWLGWTSNGAKAGTSGFSKRLEAIQIVILPSDSDAPGSTDQPYVSPTTLGNVIYQTHIENIGWQSYKTDGQTSGTTGQSLRLEGIKLYLNDTITGNIEYKTHIENIGWESDWHTNGEMSGTSGKSLRLEAIEIQLSGNAADQYDIYYRVHAQNIGWMGWASNGSPAGTEGYAYRLEAIEIVLVSKGDSAPGSTENSFQKIPEYLKAYNSIMRQRKSTNPNDYYTLVDISGDGTPELGIGIPYQTNDYKVNYRLYQLYGYSDGQAHLLFDYGYNQINFVICEDSIIQYSVGLGINGAKITYYQLQPNSTVMNIIETLEARRESNGNMSFYKNAAKISQTEYSNAMKNDHPAIGPLQMIPISTIN